jgi:hypothetical protein
MSRAGVFIIYLLVGLDGSWLLVKNKYKDVSKKVYRQVFRQLTVGGWMATA